MQTCITPTDRRPATRGVLRSLRAHTSAALSVAHSCPVVGPTVILAMTPCPWCHHTEGGDHLIDTEAAREIGAFPVFRRADKIAITFYVALAGLACTALFIVLARTVPVYA